MQPYLHNKISEWLCDVLEDLHFLGSASCGGIGNSTSSFFKQSCWYLKEQALIYHFSSKIKWVIYLNDHGQDNCTPVEHVMDGGSRKGPLKLTLVPCHCKRHNRIRDRCANVGSKDDWNCLMWIKD